MTKVLNVCICIYIQVATHNECLADGRTISFVERLILKHNFQMYSGQFHLVERLILKYKFQMYSILLKFVISHFQVLTLLQIHKSITLAHMLR